MLMHYSHNQTGPKVGRMTTFNEHHIGEVEEVA